MMLVRVFIIIAGLAIMAGCGGGSSSSSSNTTTPGASLSATSLSFTIGVGTTSAPQTVTVTNSGSAALTFSGIATSPSANYSASTSTCSANGIAAGGTCTISVTFTSTPAVSSLPGTLTITDNAGTQTVNLSGTAGTPTAALSTGTLAFNNSQVVDTSSSPQTVTLTSGPTIPLTLTAAIAISGANPGDFSLSPPTNCPASGSSLAASSSCTISVTFTPTASGMRTATLTVTDNASPTTQNVSLTGTGTAASVSLSVSNVSFGSIFENTPSTAQPVTINNMSTSALTIASVALNSSDFALTTGTGACTYTVQTLAAGANCTAYVTFTPTATGNFEGMLTFTDNAGGVTGTTQSVNLTGSGFNNTVQVSVNLGPNDNLANGLYTSVTVCNPNNSTECATIPDVQVDTGSIGLRLLGSNAAGVTGNQVSALNLPQVTDASTGYPLYECVVYGDLSYTWGPMQMATVTVGTESALQIPGASAGTGIPIQVIVPGSPATATSTPPTDVYDEDGPDGAGIYYNPCTVVGVNSENEPIYTSGADDDDVTNLGSNGILGIRNFNVDCAICTSLPDATGQYVEYDSTGESFDGTTINWFVEATPDQYQAWNPVAAFPTDNNGESLTLPSIPPGGQATATGTLTFGIGTEPNNALSDTATIYGLDCDADFLQATFNTVPYSDVDDQTDCSPETTMLIDSGSTPFFFLDAGTLQTATGVTFGTCSSGAGWYCPASTVNLSLTLYGYDATTGGVGNSNTVQFSIANTDSLFANQFAAFDDLGYSSISSGEPTSDDIIDLGLPFYFGKTIFFGIAGATTGTPNLVNGYYAF